jgi:Peptidase family S41
MAGESRLEREQAGFPIAAVYPIPDPSGAAALGPAAAPRPRGAPRPRLTPLTPAERAQVVDGLVAVLDGLYAHLPLKRARYATDPLQRLRLLRQQSPDLDDLEFHHQLAAILTGLRDGHTRYIGPAALRDWAAHLGFLVESWGPVEAPRYVVSKLTRHLIDDPAFAAGVELLWWNGVPIDRAVDLYADRETGGRPDSRRARALESLTLRALRFSPPPDERWVDIGYRDLDGVAREVRVHWRIVKPRGGARAALAAAPEAEGARAIDPAAETTRRVKMLLFAGEARAAAGTTFRRHVRLSTVDTGAGPVAVLRLWSFDVLDDKPFVAQVIRLLRRIPAGALGLVVDLRANPGGLVWAAERLLQLLSPQHILPTRFAMLATPLTRDMALSPQNERQLAPWQASLEAAVSTGDVYSAALPLTSEAGCNDIGQIYGGPVVAVVDAKTYSAADLFAAGFVDNGVGPLVSVGLASGGGGAEVWTEETVRNALLGTGFEQVELPAGAGFTIAVRRAVRTGDAVDAAGSGIEDVGVRNTAGVHDSTLRDLDDNQDLYEACGRILARLPRTGLSFKLTAEGVRVSADGLDRLDVLVDDRPRPSVDLTAGAPVDVPLPPGFTRAELLGYQGTVLRQRRVLPPP